MKCTNFFTIGEQIRAIALDELKRAVEAYGGLYRFPEEDDEDACDRPIIAFNTDFTGPVDIIIAQVSVNEKGRICITGCDKNDTAMTEIEWPADDAIPTHIHFITEAIPPVDGTDDVTSSTTGDITVDPEIIFNLATGCYTRFLEANLPFGFMWNIIRERAEDLSRKYACTDWQETDFWLTMEDESEKLIHEKLDPAVKEVAFERFQGNPEKRILKKIVDIVVDHPGIERNAIAKLADINNDEADIAIMKLFKAGFLQMGEKPKLCYECLKDHWD